MSEYGFGLVVMVVVVIMIIMIMMIRAEDYYVVILFDKYLLFDF